MFHCCKGSVAHLCKVWHCQKDAKRILSELSRLVLPRVPALNPTLQPITSTTQFMHAQHIQIQLRRRVMCQPVFVNRVITKWSRRLRALSVSRVPAMHIVMKILSTPAPQTPRLLFCPVLLPTVNATWAFSGSISTVYDTEACQPCAAGTFKDVVGNLSCVACEQTKQI